MDSFIYSINATVPIFLVMIIGWFIKQIGLIDDHFANVANRYVFKHCQHYCSGICQSLILKVNLTRSLYCIAV